MTEVREEIAGRQGAGGEGCPREVESAAKAVRAIQSAWRCESKDVRLNLLERAADGFDCAADELAELMARRVGKPVRHGRMEAERCAELLRAAGALIERAAWRRTSGEAGCRRVPLGVVGLVSPWNNPLAIAVGKIGPAVALGNGVVWKPAPAGAEIADRALQLLESAGLPLRLVAIVHGDSEGARAIAECHGIDAVTFTGSTAAGMALHGIAARRAIPFQAEMGGNNAAIVLSDADLDHAAAEITTGAFGCAGQRCTANRRVIIEEPIHDAMIERLTAATRRLGWGDPLDEKVEIGPVISAAARERLMSVIEKAGAIGARIIQPQGQRPTSPTAGKGFYVPPTLILDAPANSPIVPEESFGPILVVQRARSLDEAIDLCNGVEQGLVASIFTNNPSAIARFLTRAEAGILKVNRSTAGADAVSPFGGWKRSGIGPAEHGEADLEFFSRVQTIYGQDPRSCPPA